MPVTGNTTKCKYVDEKKKRVDEESEVGKKGNKAMEI